MKLATTFAVAVVATAVVTLSACGDAEAPQGTTDPPPPSPVATVTVLPGALTLIAGQSQQLTATTRDQAGATLPGRSVAWSTSAPIVATVSADGMVAGVGAGSATITATSEGKTGSATVSVTAAVPVTAFASVTAGGAHTCALTASGAAYCWGRGESGQIGVPVPTTTCPLDSAPFPCSKVPVAVGGGLTFAQLAGGGAHTCGLTSDGTPYCWGSNASGQLGDNAFTNRDAPVPVATALKFVRIDAGAQHTCALTNDGKAYCWGSNTRGQLGDGTTTLRSAPVAVTGGHTFQRIAAGGFNIGHTCALTSGGDAYCWGDNERGQLGIGTGGSGAAADLTPHPEPARVTAALTFTAITVGLGRHACALTATGAAHCWGENGFGALGDGTFLRHSPVPVPVHGGLALTHVIAGGFIGHTCGLTASGTGYCWGENEVGAIGDGSTTDRLEPAAVAGGLSFTNLDAGFRHTCGRATNGAVYCWGSGGAGQLGVNSTSAVAVPTKVVGQP
jgi:alpha-tubulin suppressor-like RCC1 family protein